MQRSHLAPLLAVLLCAIPGPVQAQDLRPLPAAVPLRFESWEEAASLDRSREPPAGYVVTRSRSREHRALLGGAIGASAGVVSCTVVSTLSNDSAEGGLSFCPLDSYLIIGGAGFLVGAAIGWLM